MTAVYDGKRMDGVRCDMLPPDKFICAAYHLCKGEEIEKRYRPAYHDTSDFVWMVGMPVVVNGGTQRALMSGFIRSHDASLPKPFCIVEDKADLMPSSSAKGIHVTVDELDYR